MTTSLIDLIHRLGGEECSIHEHEVIHPSAVADETFTVASFAEAIARVRFAPAGNYTFVLDDERGYDMAVLSRRPDLATYWMAQPFRVVQGERRGEVDDRWRRWKAANR
jgi:hypothetical protein